MRKKESSNHLVVVVFSDTEGLKQNLGQSTIQEWKEETRAC